MTAKELIKKEFGYGSFEPIVLTLNIDEIAKLMEEYANLHLNKIDEWPLENFPDNMPLYLDSGLFQLRSDNMEKVLLQQGVNECNIDFLERCKNYNQ